MYLQLSALKWDDSHRVEAQVKLKGKRVCCCDCCDCWLSVRPKFSWFCAVRTPQNFREGGKSLSANDAIRQASTFHGLCEIAAQLSPVSPPDIGELTYIQPKGICTVEAQGFKVHCLETLTGNISLAAAAAAEGGLMVVYIYTPI